MSENGLQPKIVPDAPTFYMPQDLYEETVKEIEVIALKKINWTSERLVKRGTKCHSINHEHFNTIKPALCYPNIMQAVKQAYDDRNYAAMYKILDIGFEINHRWLSNQLTEVSESNLSYSSQCMRCHFSFSIFYWPSRTIQRFQIEPSSS
jgi:hypothetical protein